MNRKVSPHGEGEKGQGEAKGDERELSIAGVLVRSSLALTLFSAGMAGVLFFILVLPLSATGWSKAGSELPPFAQNLLQWRVWMSLGVIGLVGLGVAALLGMRRGLARTLVVLAATLLLVAIAASGIIGWWLMLREMYSQAGADI